MLFFRTSLKLGASDSFVSREGRRTRLSPAQRKAMFKSQINRNLFAIVTFATLWSMPVILQAAELHPMVVVGIPANNVALRHPTPEYPRNALNLHISGDVLLRVQVENGVIMETTVVSNSSLLLADSASRWVAGEWKFKPSVSGVFTIPISYKQSA
jgi:Gram-negative bacterial TonB protein C-terminal